MNAFTNPQPTIEAAQALYQYDIFKPAAVFQTADGYVLGYMREMAWPPHEAAQALKQRGFEMVACCDPLLGVWKPYKIEVTA